MPKQVVTWIVCLMKNTKTPKIWWGYEIWTPLDLKWSKRGWFSNSPDFKWYRKNWTNGCHFDENHFKSGQKQFYFEWSIFQDVGTIATALARPFETETLKFSKSPDFECFPISNVRISDSHCTRLALISKGWPLSGIQMAQSLNGGILSKKTFEYWTLRSRIWMVCSKSGPQMCK